MSFSYFEGFPGGSAGRPGFNSWVRKIPWRRAWQPTLLENPMDRAWQAALCRVTQSQTHLSGIVILRKIGFTSLITFP